jgi:hypothetical protein
MISTPKSSLKERLIGRSVIVLAFSLFVVGWFVLLKYSRTKLATGFLVV